MSRLKNIEKGSRGCKDSVNGDKVGRRKEIDEEWKEDKRENQRWMKKVELPSIEGGDPIEWIYRTGKFFEVQEVRKLHLEKKLAFMSMEERVSH